MIQKQLYTGNGVSLSPVNAEGRTLSKYVRLVAEDGMAITNGTAVSPCVDVLAEDASKWVDCELPPEEPQTTEEKYNALVEALTEVYTDAD